MFLFFPTTRSIPDSKVCKHSWLTDIVPKSNAFYQSVYHKHNTIANSDILWGLTSKSYNDKISHDEQLKV